MLNFLTYLYYRINCYYQGESSRFQQRLNAYFSFCLVFVIQLMSLQFFLDSFIFEGGLNDNYFSHDPYTRRFLIAPRLAIPIFVLVYVYYRMDKKRFEVKMRTFSQESPEERDKGKKRVKKFLIGTVLFFVLSILSARF